MQSIFKTKTLFILFIILFLLKNNKSYAFLPFKEIGFISGFGYGTAGASLPEGNYKVMYGIFHLSNDLSQYIKNENLKKGIFTLYNEIHFNQVALGNWSDSLAFNNLEFGLNNGFKFMYPILPKWYVFVSGGTGPFFHNTQTVRQKEGFIFNNNFGIGTHLFLSKNISIQAMFRLRHMSNANIWMPNNGINTYNFHVGISYFL